MFNYPLNCIRDSCVWIYTLHLFSSLYALFCMNWQYFYRLKKKTHTLILGFGMSFFKHSLCHYFVTLSQYDTKYWEIVTIKWQRKNFRNQHIFQDELNIFLRSFRIILFMAQWNLFIQAYANWSWSIVSLLSDLFLFTYTTIKSHTNAYEIQKLSIKLKFMIFKLSRLLIFVYSSQLW